MGGPNTVGHPQWAPMWLPLNWRNEVSGQLPAAVMAYLDNRVEGTRLAEPQLRIVRDYLIHYIHAPCWTINLVDQDEDGARILAELRFEATKIVDADGIVQWIGKAMQIGLDPL